MADISVNEYVRTKDGYIAKIIKIDDIFIWCDCDVQYDSSVIQLENRDSGYTYKDIIINHDFDIIKLIEEGDYVNGIQVVEKYENSFAFEYEGQLFGNKQIKSIVTKERFEAMEYEVGEEDDK